MSAAASPPRSPRHLVWRRFRRHSFDEITTDKIRLEIQKAENGDEARLYEIRAYHE